MVVFACGACGESLKKNQVESHYLRQCRNCNILSCLDCGKDFFGNEYETHTKCISEEEKYSGKNFVPKPGSNKNEIKQQQWVQQVQDAVDKCRTNPRLKGILIRLKDQSNIPRKKNKFLNFLANGFHVKDPNLGNQVWEMLMENTASLKQNVASKTEPDKDTTDVKQVGGVQKIDDANGNTVNDVENNAVENSIKLSKRDRKEERWKKTHKAEKKDKMTLTNGDAMETGERNSKKENKQKDSESTETDRKSKKRKRTDEESDKAENLNGLADDANDDGGDNDDDDDDDEELQPEKKKLKTKFSWNQVVVEVLQSKGPELKMKRLRKKVLAEYLAQGCTEKSEEKLWAKFDKKIKKIPEIKIVGEKVKLKNPS